jgi:RNA polymerase-binding protein DksA
MVVPKRLSSPESSRRSVIGQFMAMASSETDAAIHIRLPQTDVRLMSAIENALTRIRHEKFGICAECGQPIGMARLEAGPWARQVTHT